MSGEKLDYSQTKIERATYLRGLLMRENQHDLLEQGNALRQRRADSKVVLAALMLRSVNQEGTYAQSRYAIREIKKNDTGLLVVSGAVVLKPDSELERHEIYVDEEGLVLESWWLQQGYLLDSRNKGPHKGGSSLSVPKPVPPIPNTIGQFAA